MTGILALDVGGSHVTAARVEGGPGVPRVGLLTRLHLDEHAGADELLDTLARAASETAAGWSPQAIGVGMPGPFDYETGIGRYTGKFAHLNGVDVGASLRARWDPLPPPHFLNDAAAFALGEAVASGAAGRTLGITLGTGLGSGFVQGGAVVMDSAGVAREGQIGWEPYLDRTAEDYVSTRRLTADYADLTGERLRPVEIAARAGNGDAYAREVFAAYGRHLGTVLAGWVRAFSPDRVVLGGNLTAACALFLPALEAALSAALDGQSAPALTLSADGERAALIGAAWSAAQAGGEVPLVRGDSEAPLR